MNPNSVRLTLEGGNQVKKAATRSATSRAPAVLVVDDEEDVLVSIKGLLRRAIKNVRLFTAQSGREGLEVLKKERIRLIITDYKMPGMDGFQFLEEAKKVAPRTASIVLTAYPDPELAARAVNELGVGLFIAKPFDLHYLINVVESILK